ncbi:MAG TPA: hypothetical protein VFB72_08145 [Verrucomicrobiae bacterium]|nr:hypothetical protein [Verrucomicrobiae bacterium]
MKNNQIPAVFLGLFLLITAANAWVIFSYNSSYRELKRLQGGVEAVSVVQALYNESVEYGKTHPDMARLLQPAAPANVPRATTATKPQPK